MKHLRADRVEESLDALTEAHLDITGAAHVEVTCSGDGTVMWVNVNGICVLRICRIKELAVQQEQ